MMFTDERGAEKAGPSPAPAETGIRPHGWKWPRPAPGVHRPRAGSAPEPPGLPDGAAEAAADRPDPPPPRPRLRLSNPRWREARGEYGAIATACVDAEAPPTPATRVVFKAWAEWGRGRRMDLPDGEGHVGEGGGTAEARIVLDPPLEDGAPVKACRYRFTARHSASETVAGGPLEAGPGPDGRFEGVIYFCPARGEYLVLPAEEDFRRLREETERLGRLRDRAARAWENPDPALRTAELHAVGTEAHALFEGASPGDAKAGLLELILVRGNPRWGGAAAWTRVRSHARNGDVTWIGAYWRKAEDAAVRRELDRLLTPQGARERSPLLQTRFHAHLFAAEPKAGRLWSWALPRKGAPADADPADAGSPAHEGPPPDRGTASDPGRAQRFAFTAEAALGRYVAGWDGGEASYDAGRKRLRLGAAGSAGFALFEGRVSLSVELPDPGGVDILAWLGAVKHREAYLADARRACRLKLRVTGSLSAFAGGTVDGALSLTGTFARIPEAEAGGEAHAFAGAQGRAECEGSLQWAPSRTGPFAVLAILTAGEGLSAGIGGGGEFRVEYRDGVFRFRLGAAACIGLGLKGNVIVDVGAQEAVALLGHLCACVDFHFVPAIADNAFAAFRAYAFAGFAMAGRLEEGARGAAEAGVERVMQEARGFARRLRDPGVGAIKAAIRSRSGERSRLRRTPPEALGALLAILMRTREPEDFQALRYILGSCAPDGGAAVSPGHKLKWTLRHASGMAIPEADGPEREAKKAEALAEGIRRIRAFARAEGEWDGTGQAPHAGFEAWFAGFLAENGMREDGL